eukprot:1009043-Pleurochrysis_carterae.AAC.1
MGGEKARRGHRTRLVSSSGTADRRGQGCAGARVGDERPAPPEVWRTALLQETKERSEMDRALKRARRMHRSELKLPGAWTEQRIARAAFRVRECEMQEEARGPKVQNAKCKSATRRS